MHTDKNNAATPEESSKNEQETKGAHLLAASDMQPIAETHEGSEATQTESERAEQRESEGKTTRQGNSSI